MADTWNNPFSDSSAQICALRYRHSKLPLEHSAGPVVLLVVKNAGKLKIYTHSALRQQISSADWDYIDELLKDLSLRAESAPDAVFQELSNLSVGLLVADAPSQIELEKVKIGELYPGF